LLRTQDRRNKQTADRNTAWVNAGKPDLTKLTDKEFFAADLKEFDALNNAWKNDKIKGREHE
jgi:hypothetical protein